MRISRAVVAAVIATMVSYPASALLFLDKTYLFCMTGYNRRDDQGSGGPDRSEGGYSSGNSYSRGGYRNNRGGGGGSGGSFNNDYYNRRQEGGRVSFSVPIPIVKFFLKFNLILSFYRVSFQEPRSYRPQYNSVDPENE